MHIRTNIRHLRALHGHSQETLSVMLGTVGFKTVGHWETGRSTPVTADLRGLSLMFRITIHDLVRTDLRRAIPHILAENFEKIELNLNL